MDDMGLSPGEMREIFQRTVIVRKPTYGIISGYHELPYICLGKSIESETKTTRVKGKIHVSPKFLITPEHYNPSYDDIFGEGNVDKELSGRVFGFMGFRERPVECSSEYLDLKHMESSVDRVLSESLDELERHEDITTGVIITPNSRYYPISIERFIAGVLEDEFSV